MSLTQSAWTKSTVNKRLVLKCTVTSTTGETDTYTLKTPINALDPTRPWLLVVNAAATDISDATDPVDIWAGYSDSFVLSGQGASVTATDGGEVASDVMDGVSDETLITTVNPNRTAAKVQAATGTAGEVNAGTAPYYAINVDGGGARKDADTIFYIIQ